MGILCLNNDKKRERENVRVNLHEWHVEGVVESVSGEEGGSHTSQRQTSHSVKLSQHTQKTETNTGKDTWC